MFLGPLMTLILHFTSHPLKQTLILAKSLTSDPYNRGLLKRRKSVDHLAKNSATACFGYADTALTMSASPDTAVVEFMVKWFI